MKKDLLDLYSDYLISQNHHATATGLAAMLDGEVSHDQVSRFLREDDYGSSDLWSYVKPDVRKHEKSVAEGLLIVDDTISEKNYTDENAVNCWHYSHAKHRCVKGINLLSCLVRYGDISLPIGYGVVKKDIIYSDLKTKHTRRKSSTTKNAMFRDQVQQAINNNVLFAYVLADNWFGSKANMSFVNNLGKSFIFGIKSNRCVAMSLHDAKSGQFQQVKQLKWEDGESRTVYLKDIAFPVQLLKKVFKNEDGSQGVLYLVTNNLTIDANRLYEVYQKRWRIEEFHKSIKQNASLSKSPTKTIRTQCNHLFASMVAFCKLEMLKVKTAMNHFAIKQKLLLKANQIMFNELAQLRAAA